MDKSAIFCKLIHLAEKNNISVGFAPLPISRARYKGTEPGKGKIVVRQNLSTIDDYNYEIAHELAHSYLHYDKGNILRGSIDNEQLKHYEQQADRAAKMILDVLNQE